MKNSNRMVLLWSIMIMFAAKVNAHSGGTDANGCHAGSQPYHCHNPKKSPPSYNPPRRSKPRPPYRQPNPKPPRYSDGSLTDDLGLLCRRAVRMVADDLGGTVYQWGHKSAWRRRSVYYFRQWFTIERYSGTLRPMRITCCYDTKTQKIGEAVIDDV